MIRTTLIAGLLTTVAIASPALAVDTAAAASAYTTAETTIGTLLDNPAAKAAVDKNLPELSTNPQIRLIRGMTLKQIQQFKPDMITDETLAHIDADLAKLPAQK